MSFAHPEALWFFIIVPLMIVLFLQAWRARMRAREIFSDRGLLARLNPHLSDRRLKVKDLLVMSGLVFLIFALAGPQIGAKTVTIRQKGLDVFLALDCSYSMAAEDLRPSRMARARSELKTLVEKLRGNRMGVIAFAGTAFVQCPLTLDESAVKMFLDELDTDSVPVPGTAIGDAVRLAVQNFPESDGEKVLVLLTDGEDHHSQPLKAAEEAKKKGVRIYCIGFGDPRGQMIPERDETGKVAGYRKDVSGNPVTSKLDEKTLREMAAATGGWYYNATYGEWEVDRLAADLHSLRKRDLEAARMQQFEDRFMWPLALAFLLLAADLFIPEVKAVAR
jgi:Ca-activated chloride channel family protein